MMERGRIRIGTIHDYWDDRHSPSIQDKKEGAVDSWHVADHQPGDPGGEFWANGIFDRGVLATARISNVTVSNQGGAAISTAADSYAFCTTCSDEAINSLTTDGKHYSIFDGVYDACIKIGPLDKFAFLLLRDLRLPLNLLQLPHDYAEYGDRRVSITRGRLSNHPGFLKGMKYGDQKEYRFLGLTRDLKISPQTRKIPSLKQCFEWHHSL